MADSVWTKNGEKAKGVSTNKSSIDVNKEYTCKKCGLPIRYPDRYKDVYIYPPWQCQSCQIVLCNYCLWSQPNEDLTCPSCKGKLFKPLVPESSVASKAQHR